MTAVGHVVKILSLKIGATEYNTAVTAVKETPTRSQQTSYVASGEGVTDVGPASWTLDVTANASYAAGSFLRHLLDNDGEVATITYEPDPTNEPGVLRTGDVVLLAPATDYTVGNFATFQVSLPCKAPFTTEDPA